MIAVASFLVIGATRQTQQQQTQIATEQRDGQTRLGILARNAAMLGLEQAEHTLTGSSSSFVTHSGSGSLSSASYTYKATVASVTASGCVSAKDATIWTRGYVTDATGSVIEYKAIKKMRQCNGSSGTGTPTLPSFLNYSLLVNNGISFNGNVRIDTFRVAGTSGRSPNANIHSNQGINISGNAATVRGFGSYVSSVSAKSGIFKPYNPSNQSKTAKVAAIPMSTNFLTLAAGLATSADRVTVGNQTLSGTYDFTALGATREDPYVWYVGGNLTASSSVTIKGYVVFVALGNLSLSGGASASFGDTRPESHAAWYAGGNMTLGGNSAIWGQFYVHGNLNLHGTPSVYGNIAVNGSATISGTPNVYNVPASAYLTGLWQAPTTSTVSYTRLAYSEGWE